MLVKGLSGRGTPYSMTGSRSAHRSRWVGTRERMPRRSASRHGCRVSASGWRGRRRKSDDSSLSEPPQARACTLGNVAGSSPGEGRPHGALDGHARPVVAVPQLGGRGVALTRDAEWRGGGRRIVERISKTAAAKPPPGRLRLKGGPRAEPSVLTTPADEKGTGPMLVRART